MSNLVKGKVVEIKPTVLSFRVTMKQAGQLGAILENENVFGVKSGNQYARKIVSDFLAGRLVYKDPKHKLGDMDQLRA